MITQYHSRKIKVLNLVLILMVLYIHSYYIEAQDFPVALVLQKISGNNGLARVSIPLFFCLSGFLFFHQCSALRDCSHKMQKRVRTLLEPYILWNVVFLLWYIVLQNTPGIGSFVNSDMVSKILGAGLLSGIKELLWVPAGFHLWFLRDLLLMVVLSPFVYVLCRYLRWLVPAILWCAMFALAQLGCFQAIDFEIYRMDGIVFYAIGACLSMHSSLDGVDRWLKPMYVTVCGVVYCANAVWQGWGSDFGLWYNTLTGLCGYVFIWRVYDWVQAKLPSLRWALGYSFFIYLFHEPAFNIIKKVGLRVLGVHEWSLILLYFVNPLIMCVVAIGVAKMLQRFVPRLYSVLVGGR